jgi:hypothetical protein
VAVELDHMESPGFKGRVAEFKAVQWLWSQGYDVFPNASPQGPIDLIAVDRRTGKAIYIDVKMGRIYEQVRKHVLKSGEVAEYRNLRLSIGGGPNSANPKAKRGVANYGGKNRHKNGRTAKSISSNCLTDEQRRLGVRLLIVVDDYVGWIEDHPLLMLEGLMEAHYSQKKVAKSGSNQEIMLDQEQNVII